MISPEASFGAEGESSEKAPDVPAVVRHRSMARRNSGTDTPPSTGEERELRTSYNVMRQPPG